MQMPGRGFVYSSTTTSTTVSPAAGGGTATSPVKLYEHTFNSPYNYPYSVAPPTLSAYLTTSGWTNSQGAWQGSSGVLYLPGSSVSPSTITLTLNVQNGYSLSVTSFAMLCKSQNGGYANWSMTINGIFVGSGTMNVGNSVSYSSLGGAVANAVSGLTGTATVVITLSGAAGNGQFRIDNFVLNGFIQQITTSTSVTVGKDYRYGFNGKENDNEVKGEGAQQDYGMRIYDPRLGRFLSVDPLTRNFPWYTTYQFAGNKPIWALDLDGAEEWYYYNNLFGWKRSALFAGPYTENAANELGYHSAAQVHQIIENKRFERGVAERASIRKDANEAVKKINGLNNPFALAYEISPASSAIPIAESLIDGSYVSAAIMSAGAIADIGPLFRTFGKGYSKVASEIASKFTLEGVWGLGNNLARGILIEAKLASKYIDNGMQWMAEVSPFFRGFDFYDKAKGLAVSLKSVNATKNFDFKNIMKNIDDLHAMKGKSTAQYGSEYMVRDVQLDIAIPKGYDRSLLNEVKNYGEQKLGKGKVNIFEVDQ
jgi:RHS repeat-associated protein